MVGGIDPAEPCLADDHSRCQLTDDDRDKIGADQRQQRAAESCADDHGKDAERHAETCAPFGMTTMPASETVKRVSVGLGVEADPGAGVDAHVLVDDRPANGGVASDVDAVQQHRVLDRRVGVHPHAGGEDRPADDAARDDHAGADDRVVRGARAAGLVEDELRRRQRAGEGEDRPVVVVEVEDRVDARSGRGARRSRRRASRRRASSRARARRSPGRSLCTKSQTCARPCSTIIGMMLLADVVRRGRRRRRRP